MEMPVDGVAVEQKAIEGEGLRAIWEAERLSSLRSLDMLDTEAEQQFDDLTRLASFVCETPISLVSLVDEHRQWFKAKVGVEISETPRSGSICSHAIEQDSLFITEDASADERFKDMPLVVAGAIRLYAGAPIRSPEGLNVGSLCVIDPKPRTLTQAQQDALIMLGRQASAYLLMKRQVQQLTIAAREFNAIEQELRENQVLLEGANRKLQELASTDPLTGLTNRRALETRMTAHQESATALSVLMMDVDHFKKINDTQSHEAGDAVLRQVADLLRIGTRETDTISRYGGEEFVLLMPGASHEAAIARAERLRAAIATSSPVTISIGVATAPSCIAGVSVSDLLANADRALYVAKQEGRNCVRSAQELKPVLKTGKARWPVNGHRVCTTVSGSFA